MKLRKGIPAFILICLCFICTQNVFAASAAAAISEESAKWTGADLVELHCVSPDGEGAYVTVGVTHPEMNRPFYVCEVQAGENGVVDLTLKMSKASDLSGKYTVYFGGANLEATKTAPFIFINDGDDIFICEAISNKTDGIADILDTIDEKCGIERGEGTLFAELSEIGQGKVYDALKSRTFTQGIDVKEAFDQATVLQIFKEKKNPADVEVYADILGISVGTGSDYSSLDTDFKKRVCDGVVSYDFALNKPEEVLIVFNKLIYTQLINTVSKENRNDLIQYIQEVIDLGYTDISLTKYNGSDFDDDDRLNVVKKVLEDRDKELFSELDDVKESFTDAVAAVEQEKAEAQDKVTAGKNNTGGGGGGGGGLKVTVGYGNSTDTTVELDKTTEVSPIFKDTDSVPWAAEAIDYLYRKGVVNGVSDDEFEPNRYITREEFVQIIIKAFEIPTKKTEHVFTDVRSGDWFYDSVMTAYASAIVNGIDELQFGVNLPITREQLCVIAYRAQNAANIKIESEQFEVVFKDKEMVADYAVQAVESMYRAGIVNGVGNNDFAPKAHATRAMAAKIVYGLLKRG